MRRNPSTSKLLIDGPVCFWGYTYLDTFKESRGYDLTPYLPFIIRTGGSFMNSTLTFTAKFAGSDGIFENQIHYDYFQNLTDMYIDNLLVPLRTYLNDELCMKLRYELPYGVTYEITEPRRAVDYCETESLEFSNELDPVRIMAGSAHVWGIRLSSETGGQNMAQYRYGQEKFVQIFNTQYAAGISHTVLHGYASIEGADSDYLPSTTARTIWSRTYWPGHEAMNNDVSERYGPRQPAYQHYEDYFKKIARDEAILTQGIPQIDIGMLRTEYTLNNGLLSMQGPSTNGDYLRTRRPIYWQDLTLQDNGYTYDYFAPENLELLAKQGVNMYGDGVLLPDRVGYQALIIYQEAMPYGAALEILKLAKQGLPVVIVNNVTERSIQYNFYTTKKAASRSLYNDGSDADLKLVIDEMKKLNNVIELNSDADTYNALLSLGVRPRAQFTQTNQSILTTMRKTDETAYLYVYNFMEKIDYCENATAADGPVSVNLSVDVAGKPYCIDTWTGEILEVADYIIAGDRTDFKVTLEPGQTAYFAFDRSDAGDDIHIVSTDADKAVLSNGKLSVYATKSGTYTTSLSDGSVKINTINAPTNINLNNWSLKVESWTRGDKMKNYEDRGKGYTTVESWWTTKKTMIDVGTLPSLVSWKNIPALGQSVCGVGYYRTSFTLPADWSKDKNGAYLKIDDLCRNTSIMYVNGVKSTGFDFVARVHDISDLLKPGENIIEIEVSSTLYNIVKAMGAEAGINYSSLANIDYRDYGMVGNVNLITYTTVPVQPNVLASIRAEEANVAVNNPASYTVSLNNTKGVGIVELSFTFDGYVLDKDNITVTPLNGFALGINPEPAFQYIGSGIWKGSVKYMYLADKFVNVDGPLDIVKISGTAIDTGSATVTLTGFAALGDTGSSVGPMSSQILMAEATANIGAKPAVYSKYDLNKDGSIDETDLLYLVYFYQWNDRDVGWDTLDLYGIFAKDCDFQVNGKVDLADMIELTANYGIYDPYA